MVAGYNTIRFLFNQKDLTTASPNKLTFVFGDAVVPCIENHLIDQLNFTFSFECGCKVIDRSNGDFVLDCSGSGGTTTAIFTNVISNYGYRSNTSFSIDFNNVESYLGYSSTSAIIATDLRLSGTAYFGNASTATISKTALIDGTSSFGYYNSANLLYNPYNELFANGQYGLSSFGYDSRSFVIYNPYNEFFDTGEYAQSSYGYDSTSFIVYNPYNEFFDAGEHAQSSYGYYSSTFVLYNPYNELFSAGQDGRFYFGYESKNSVQFNPYNPFSVDITSHFGYDSTSSIRYSDDPYINDINFYFGTDSNVSLSYGDNRANIVSTQHFGYYSSNSVIQSIGFVASSYFGIYGRLRYIRTNVTVAIFNNCQSAFGYTLLDNGRTPRFLDLSSTSCCTIQPLQLLHIEMTDEHDYDVRYGLHRGWGIACVAELQARPRFSANAYFGETANVVDSTVYLGQIEFGFGLSVNTRSMYLEKNYDIPYGNFIVSQNEIKVELTKPLDVSNPNIVMYIGFTSSISLGASYHLGITRHQFGLYSSSSITIEEAIRPRAYFGYHCYGSLATRAVIGGTAYIGSTSIATLYEDPYLLYFGCYSSCEGITTENYVELLEEGELDNDYIYQNENGDPDLDRPNGESIEGHPYFRYIKGRCY